MKKIRIYLHSTGEKLKMLEREEIRNFTYIGDRLMKPGWYHALKPLDRLSDYGDRARLPCNRKAHIKEGLALLCKLSAMHKKLPGRKPEPVLQTLH